MINKMICEWAALFEVKMNFNTTVEFLLIYTEGIYVETIHISKGV